MRKSESSRGVIKCPGLCAWAVFILFYGICFTSIPGVCLELHRHDVALGLDDGRPGGLVAAEDADLPRAVDRGTVEGGDVVELATRVDLQLQVVESVMSTPLIPSDEKLSKFGHFVIVVQLTFCPCWSVNQLHNSQKMAKVG